MTSHFAKARRRTLICGAAIAAVLAATPALAAEQLANIDIAAQPMDAALKELAKQSGANLLFSPEAVKGLRAKSLQTTATPEDAARMLLAGTDLFVKTDSTGSILVTADPQSGSAAGDGADGTVQALIVTAQKREENIQDVPIAISAFTEKSLQEQKIEGGFDLLKAIPNVTFSKNNFTSYNFSIRGVGTKAVSATTDPGVAVAFNNSGLIVNRLFEQEYVDIERVEVLRGPQGTLYGRNATSGVINVISAKPNLTEFSGWLKGEVGNYNAKRLSTMLNIPLVNDKLGLRFAGALTKRDGYGYNAVTKSDVDGRDLWSARLTLGFKPIESLRANLIWERFNENDERARTSKQLCHTDPGPTSIGSVTGINTMAAGDLSQGCLPGSLYDAGAFGAPNGNSLPFIFPLRSSDPRSPIQPFVDPYSGLEQSRDLREISSRFDPIYRARADVVELNVDYDLTPALTLVSQTLYDKDRIYSTQDYNRFNSRPVINPGIDNAGCYLYPTPYSQNACPGGYFNDPQLGPSNQLVVQDISQGHSSQFSQEFRIQSKFDGPVNFSIGANYVTFKNSIDYYVLSNAFTILTRMYTHGVTDPASDPYYNSYIDPNPLESIDGNGQNYFHSKNPYKLKSKSIFGELYWDVSRDVKITAGLRYTNDEKTFEEWPTVLLDNEVVPFHQDGEIKQSWSEPTGRLVVDWTPDLAFTDKTMIYASYSRGYKAGGANPPNMAPITDRSTSQILPVPLNAIHAATFKPEFVNAFEVGTKNVLMGGALVFNATGFYYDYKDYQISQIVDRIALNENFDAKIWGLEFETLWSPTPNLRFNANLGYLDTQVGKGQKSIDTMNRTAGHDDWAILKNWVQYPSNCIVPKAFLEAAISGVRDAFNNYFGGTDAFTDSAALMYPFASACEGSYSPNWTGWPGFPFLYEITGASYDPYAADGATQWGVANMADSNWGAGFYTDLSGKELPNAPHWTANLGAQYSHPILDGTWTATVRADGYWQSQSWARIYNLNPYDKLHGWYNANLSVWVENDKGLKIEAYAKNILNKDAITDAFLNSDDSGLTTNVFTLDPRLIGVSIKQDF